MKNAFTSFEADRIIQRLSYYHPEYRFIENDTLILFDEIQAFMDATTALKFFKLQGKYDVICSGSELGIHNQTISSAAVGFKEEKVMHALDFEEFLWAKGYPNTFSKEIIEHMVRQKPFDTALLETADELFMEYILVGGYPRIVDTFIQSGNYSNILDMQKALHRDYQDDISKYLNGMDSVKAMKIYQAIPSSEILYYECILVHIF